MSRELSELIDKALERRSFLVGLLSRVVANADNSEAVRVGYQIAELDGLLALAAKTTVIH